MNSLSIVANNREYKIYDNDEKETIVKGINSFRSALTVYERLSALKDSVASFSRNPCRHRLQAV